MCNSQTQLICVTGADGSGKSTLIEKLTHQFPNAVECNIWAAFSNPDIHLFTSKLDIDDYLCALTPNSRALFLAHAICFSIEKAKQTQAKHILINAYFYKYFSSELCLGADEKLITNLISFFPKVDKTIFLKLSPEEVVLRKTNYSRYECGCKQATQAEFITFQNRCAPILEKFIQPHWLLLNAEENPEVLCEKAKEFILQK